VKLVACLENDHRGKLLLDKILACSTKHLYS